MKSTKRVGPVEAPKMGRSTQTRLKHEEIAQRAYEIYLAEGRPDGRHLEHWQRAQTELFASRT